MSSDVMFLLLPSSAFVPSPAFLSSAVLLIALVAANVLGVAMLIPQTVRLARNRNVRGVSPGWIGVGIGINLAWVAFAIERGLPGLLPVSLCCVVVYTAMGFAVRACDEALAARVVRSALALVVLFGLSRAIGGSTAFGSLLAMAYCVQFLPAAVSAVRTQVSDGVAPATWRMALVEAVIWAGYGVAEREVALVVGSLGAAVLSAAILTHIDRPGTTARRNRVGMPARTI